MALYSELQVFKSSYDLLLLVFRATPNVTREHRYTLLEKVKENTIQLCIEIYHANQMDDKEPSIIRALECVMQIRLTCRVLRDLNQISSGLFSQLFILLESINKQLTLWKKYQHQKSRPQSATSDK